MEQTEMKDAKYDLTCKDFFILYDYSKQDIMHMCELILRMTQAIIIKFPET